MFSKKVLTAINCALIMLLIAIILVGCDTTSKPIITLDKRNGEPLEQVEVSYIGEATYQSGAMLFPNPTREGWFFNGWFLDEQCTQSAYDYPVKQDTIFYAGWVDSITVPFYHPTWLIKDYSELFTATTKVEPYEMSPYGLPQLKITLNVTPKGDFTGINSTDRFELQITHYWLSDEKFMGEYVSNDVVASVCMRNVWLEKDKDYTLLNEVIIMEYNNENLEYPITSFTLSNPRTKTVINYIFDEPTLQYKH